MDTCNFVLFALLFINVWLQSKALHLSPKIVGGTITSWNTYPFMASLAMQESANAIRLCGGSIIASTWILTAAHCITGIKKEHLFVFIGSSRFAHGIRHEAGKLIVHPDYDQENNDIALVELVKPVLNGQGKKVRLNHEQGFSPGMEAILVGWGLTRDDTEAQSVPLLHSITLKVATCQAPTFIADISNRLKWIAGHRSKQGRETIICTSTRDHQGACVGDSGGPLLINGKQVGIVSRGTPCARGVPDIYTNVPVYIPWIEEQTKQKF